MFKFFLQIEMLINAFSMECNLKVIKMPDNIQMLLKFYNSICCHHLKSVIKMQVILNVQSKFFHSQKHLLDSVYQTSISLQAITHWYLFLVLENYFMAKINES